MAEERHPDYESLGWRAWLMSEFIDHGYPKDLPAEVVHWRRISKVSMEAAEALEAYAGSIGENFRKGVTCDLDKVTDELLDTAFAALCAVEHLLREPGASVGLLEKKAYRVLVRAGLVQDVPSVVVDGYDAVNDYMAEQEIEAYERDRAAGLTPEPAESERPHRLQPGPVGLASNPRPKPAVPEHWMLTSHPYVEGGEYGCQQVVTTLPVVFGGVGARMDVEYVCGRSPHHAVHTRPAARLTAEDVAEIDKIQRETDGGVMRYPGQPGAGG